MNEAQIAALLQAEREFSRTPVWRRVANSLAIAFCTAALLFLFLPRNSTAPAIVQAVPAKGRAAQPVQQGSMNLTWAPAPGADSYHVIVFKGNHVQVSKTTHAPSLKTSLGPGRYHWVVWPVTKGIEGKATVSAILTVR